MAIKLLLTKNSMKPPYRLDKKRSTLPNTSAKFPFKSKKKILDAKLTNNFFLPFLIFGTSECMVSFTEGEYTRLK